MARKSKTTNAEDPAQTQNDEFAQPLGDDGAPLPAPPTADLDGDGDDPAARGLEEPPPIDATVDPSRDQRPPSSATRIDPSREFLPPLAPDATIEDKRAQVVLAGLVTAEEAEVIAPEHLDTLVQSIDPNAGGAGAQQPTREGEPAIVPPFTSAEPERPNELGAQLSSPEGRAGRLDAQLRSLSREDQIALITRGPTSFSIAEAANLVPDDLLQQARAVLAQQLASEEDRAPTRALDAMAPPPVGTPYGDDPPQHYAVLDRVTVAEGGQVVTMQKGTIVNDRTHDIAGLLRAGAQLVKCDPPPPYTS